MTTEVAVTAIIRRFVWPTRLVLLTGGTLRMKWKLHSLFGHVPKGRALPLLFSIWNSSKDKTA